MFTKKRPAGGGGGSSSRRGEQASAPPLPPPPPPPQESRHSESSSRGRSRGRSRDGSLDGGRLSESVSSSRRGSGREVVQTQPSASRPQARETPMPRQASIAALVPAAATPAVPNGASAERTRPPPPFGSSRSARDSGSAVAPFSSVPGSTAGGALVTMTEPLAYLFTEEFPFTSEQFDRQKESLLGREKNEALDEDVPQMDLHSRKQLGLSEAVGRTLEEWDLECARKHLDAVEDSVVTHEDLHSSILLEGERPIDVLDLAGLEDAPGVLNDVTQRCCLAFTDKNRLVFTQTRHSAEVGLPKMRCLASLMTCFHDRWSRRKWTSYYAAINASEVLQVFVQQTLVTSYQTSTCTFNDCCDALCCPIGGTMYSEKDIDGVTQTLGDHDPSECMSRWDKTRYMRHALVIRYVDVSSNSVRETTAFAVPTTPAAKLYEMARSIEAGITIRTADWLKNKTAPTPLFAAPFQNAPPPPSLFRRTSYKLLIFVLFAVALGFLALNPTAAVFMLLAVVASLAGSYANRNATRKAAHRATGLMLGAGWGGVSKSMLGSQGGGLTVYAIAFFVTVSNSGGGDDDDTGSSYPY